MIRTLVASICICILFSSATSAVHAEAEVTGINIIEYGLYSVSKAEDVESSSSPSGFSTHVDNILLKTKTTDIPAVVGNQFGLRYYVKGAPEGKEAEITIIVKYPPPGVKNPDTNKVYLKNTSKTPRLIGKPYFFGYQFDYPWEIVPGSWIVELWHNNKKFAEKEFKVIK
ncbi:MAG: DUF3859 domain-containing protein [Deltaproteobacteria bacterium]|nr:DUF3859 domain-containing protein [Deltaproteobacteria bacterium]